MAQASTVGSRFLSMEPHDLARRRSRKCMREAERHVDERSRAGSRHRIYPCCQRRRAQCNCNAEVEKFINKKELMAFETSLGNSELLKVTDTADCGEAVSLVAEVASDSADLGALFALCGMWGPWAV